MKKLHKSGGGARPSIRGMLSKLSILALLSTFAAKLHSADGPGIAKLLHPEFPNLTQFVHLMVDTAPLHRKGGLPKFSVVDVTPHEIDGVHGAVATVYSKQPKFKNVVSRNTIEVRIKDGNLLIADFISTGLMEEI